MKFVAKRVQEHYPNKLFERVTQTMHQLFSNTIFCCCSFSANQLFTKHEKLLSLQFHACLPAWRRDLTWTRITGEQVTDEDVQRPHSANAKRILNANEWIGVKNAPRQPSAACMFEQVRSSRNMQHVVQATKRTSWILCFRLRLRLRLQLRLGLRSLRV